MSKVRSAVTLLAIAAASFTLAGCAGSEPRASGSSEAAVSSAPQHVEIGFLNTEAGYTFMYPDNWPGHILQEDTLEWQQGRLDADNVVVFYYKDFNSDAPAVPLLALSVYSKAHWAELQDRALDRNQMAVGHVVGVKGHDVLVAYINNRNPFAPDTVTGQAFASRVPTPEQVAGAISW